MHEELVTKSVRLTPAESERLAQLAARLHCSEGSLLKRFVAEGLHEAQLSEGMLAYVRGQASVGEASRIADLTEEDFQEQLRLRGILGPGALSGENAADADLFLASLRQAAARLGSTRLRQAVEQVRADEAQGKPVRT